MEVRHGLGAALVLAGVLVSSPVAADDEWPLHAALGGFMTLNGIDLAQTMYCIGRELCQERNPAAAPLVQRPALVGALKIGLDSAVVYALLRLHPTHRRWAWALTGLGIAVETWATVQNARQLRAR